MPSDLWLPKINYLGDSFCGYANVYFQSKTGKFVSTLAELGRHLNPKERIKKGMT